MAPESLADAVGVLDDGGSLNAVCLETQHHPDAVHHNNFPSTELAPGDMFRSTTRMTFKAQ
mgnify:CR=1 FL=1